PWPTTHTPRRAAISSFGISGTNAHVIIEEPPTAPARHVSDETDTENMTWVLSARDEGALSRAAGRLAEHAGNRPALSATAIADALARRETHPHRAVLQARTREDLITQATALATGHNHPATTTGTPAPNGKLAVLFAGQGSQYPGMGRELAAAHPRFDQLLRNVAAHFDTHLEHPLLDIMWAQPDTPHADLLNDTLYTQPALFTLETALITYLQEHGLTPDYLMGHSIGEITAAHTAGILTLTDACTLVTTRARLMHQLPHNTGMLTVTAPAHQLHHLLTHHPDIDIAAHNSPRHTTLAGTHQALTHLTHDLTTHHIPHHTLPVSAAFHSRHLDPLLNQLTTTAHTLTHQPPTTPLITNTTGQLATTHQLTNPTHWATQARTPVHYHQGITTLTQLGVTTYLEIGPDTTLTHLTQTTLNTLNDNNDSSENFGSSDAERKSGNPNRRETITVIPTQNPRTDQTQTFTTALATLHTTTPTGLTWPTTPTPTAELPTYPFTRNHYWLTPEPRTEAHHLGFAATDHPLLATSTELPDGTHLLTTTLTTAAHPWLNDHTIAGTTLLPGTALLELALHAGRRTGCEEVEELLFQVPVALSADREKVLHLLAGPVDESGRRPITIYSRDADEQAWTRNATGTLAGV
ncbi:acyltransferase domain-containing protein, partial [Streptomyces sp. NPDC005279]|uniref:acyltransferase domain-containing protein n=1 Tax=Streptomyces sp. NPDC005279 TaxID=3364712 RepID=UPI0036BB6B79